VPLRLSTFLTAVVLFSSTWPCFAQVPACHQVLAKTSAYADLTADTLQTLEVYAQTPTSRRRQLSAEAWLRYKNTPGPVAARIDLSAPELFADDTVKNSRGYPISRYEDAVLKLRKGDWITIGERRYHLGSFLGAGNATHVFADADNPAQAIRIPYLVIETYAAILPALTPYANRPLPPRFWYWPTVRFADAALLNLQQRGLEHYPNSVKLLEMDPLGRVAVVSRVQGNEVASSFIGGLLTPRARESSPPKELYYPDPQKSYETGSNFLTRPESWPRETKIKMQLLVDAMVANQHGRIEYGYASLNTGLLRQYVWDTSLNEWLYVDHEEILTENFLDEVFAHYRKLRAALENQQHP